MGRRQLPEIHLGPWTQLGDHLAGAEGTEPATVLKWLPLGLGMQETGGIEITGTSGVDQSTQLDRRDPVAGVVIEDH